MVPFNYVLQTHKTYNNNDGRKTTDEQATVIMRSKQPV